jgi:quercetin dioxygenase-like cupin family protein
MIRLDSIEKILQHSQADISGFLRVKLHAEHMAALDRAGEGHDMGRHSHVHEQISSVESGALRFITPAGDKIVRAGETLCIPPNLPHGVQCLEDCIVVDIFSPVREDWVRGDDASIEEIGPKVPAMASASYGEPFLAIFERSGHDFYKIDPHLFSPAEIVFQNLDTGRVQRFGGVSAQVLARSFGLQ